MRTYGKELILDIHHCKNTELFNRGNLEQFFIELCDLLNMEKCDLHFWDYVGEEAEYREAPVHLRGTSAIQFISTSNITIHTLDEMRRVYLNVFSCKNFKAQEALDFCENYFDGVVVNYKVIERI